VLHKDDTRGVDTLRLNASGLPANTDFSVFMTSVSAFSSTGPGFLEYLGGFSTNAGGIASLKVDAVIAEAFVSVPTTGPNFRRDLNTMVVWFADPVQAEAACGLTTVTPFDGDGEAGPVALSSLGGGQTGLGQFPPQ
jgi:hypothetical protein